MKRPAIELTSKCQHNCQMCPFRYDSNFNDLGDMEWDTFTKIFDEIAPTAESVMLFNRGEPFLYKKIYEAIAYVQEKLPVVLSTNGELVDPEKLFKVFQRGTLVVSIPAGDAETHKKITGCNSFEKVKKNVIELQLLKPEEVEMYCKMVKQPENQGHEELLKEFCQHVVVVEDSNQPNPKNYTDCTQPDITPVYDWHGNKKVCCRDELGQYPHEEYYEQAIMRDLPICKNCGIR